MFFSIILFLLSVTDTDSFTPFPSGYSISQVNGVNTVSVQQEEGFFSAEPEAPFLPLVSRVFILPGRIEVNSVSLSIDEPLSKEQLNAPLAGAPVVQPVGEVLRNRLTATTRSISIENQSVSVHTGHILDAYTIVSCSVSPWVYDASSRELGLSPSCTIELDWTRVRDQSNLSEQQIEMLNFRTEAIAEKFGISFSGIPYIPGTDSSTDYLVITGEDFLDDVTVLEELIETRGLSFQTLAVQEISGNWNGADVQEDIRNCIKYYAYNEGTTYVVLAGDENVVPVRDVYTECEGLFELTPSDLYYSDLDGSWDFNGNGIYGEWADSLDLYADVLLGRLLFSTSEGAAAILDKNTVYANVSSGDTWYKNAVLCAGYLFPEIGYTGDKGCEIMAGEFPTDFTLTKSYELSVGDYPDTYFPVLYQGAGWNHYSGHGNPRGVYWANSSGILTISRMNGFSEPSAEIGFDANGGRTGVHSSIACHTGDFTDSIGLGLCLADTLLTLPDGGGVACLFNTSWGWEGYWPQIGSSERLCNYTVEQVYQQKASSLGLAFTAAKDLEIPNMTGPYDRVMQSVIAYSAFMDPSLQVLGVSNYNPIPPPAFRLVMFSPNPLTAGEELEFKVTGMASSYDAGVYDISGRTVCEPFTVQQNSRHSQELGLLPNGVYFVSAETSSGLNVSESFVVLAAD